MTWPANSLDLNSLGNLWWNKGGREVRIMCMIKASCCWSSVYSITVNYLWDSYTLCIPHSPINIQCNLQGSTTCQPSRASLLSHMTGSLQLVTPVSCEIGRWLYTHWPTAKLARYPSIHLRGIKVITQFQIYIIFNNTFIWLCHGLYSLCAQVYATEKQIN